MNRLNVESLEVTSIACLLGCKPSSGLVNTLNELRESGAFGPASTYGDILIAFLDYKLAEARRYAAERAGSAS